MKILVNWLISTLAIVTAAYLLPGVHIQNFMAALVAALVLGIVNAVLRPVLLFLTLPLNFLTFGLFTLVVNAALIMLTSTVVVGFVVENFWWALIFGLVLSIINFFLHRLSK